MKKKPFIIAGIILLVLAALVAIAYYFVFSLARPVNTKNISESENVRIEIPNGMTITEVAHLLKEKNLIKSEKFFYYTARFPEIYKFIFLNPENSQFVLKSGIYYVNDTMNIAQIQDLLSSGQTEYIKVSVPEGLTISQIGEILEQNGVCNKEDFKASTRKSEILNEFSIPAQNAEGYVFPDTYFFIHDMNSDEVARTMISNFFQKITTIENIETLTPEEFHKTVILASIVEKEYGTAEEAPLIASVFKNRLRRNIGLYSCATIVYIITEILGRPHPDRVLIEDTKIDNPYNTYKWAGLTPGPISNPGLIALDASVNTPKTKYYFFQVVDPETGRQEFTETFEEHKINHNLNVKK